MLQLWHQKEREAEYASSLRAESLKQGWDLFPEELVWYIYDFFTFALDPYEKLVFYGHYIVGFNLKELAERVAKETKTSRSKVVSKCLEETRDTWRIEDERNKRNKQYSTKNKRRS